MECKSCRRTFSENRGTLFFRLKTPKEKVLKALQCLAEGNSVSSTARIVGTKRDTIRKWLKKAARHVEAVNDYLICNLKLTRVQLDEMWSYVKKKARRCGPKDPQEYGDAWTLNQVQGRLWKAMDPDSKLRIATVVGKRTQQEADQLIQETKEKLDPDQPPPSFSTDGLTDYSKALFKEYSQEVKPVLSLSKGRNAGDLADPARSPRESLIPSSTMADSSSAARRIGWSKWSERSSSGR